MFLSQILTTLLLYKIDAISLRLFMSTSIPKEYSSTSPLIVSITTPSKSKITIGFTYYDFFSQNRTYDFVHNLKKHFFHLEKLLGLILLLLQELDGCNQFFHHL